MWDLIVATVATGADIIVVILWKYVRRDSLEGAQIPRKKRVDWGGRYEVQGRLQGIAWLRSRCARWSDGCCRVVELITAGVQPSPSRGLRVEADGMSPFLL